MSGFKKPFKAVPLKPKRLKGIEEFHDPLWSPPAAKAPINWGIAAIGLLIGVCLGLALVLSAT